MTRQDRTSQPGHDEAADTAASTEWIAFARIGKPHGLRGATFIVRDDADGSEIPFEELLITELGSPVARERRRLQGIRDALPCALIEGVHVVAESYVSGGRPVVRFEGVTTREQAETLQGGRLSVHRDDLETDDEDDSFIVADLKGLKVIDASAGFVGTVVGVVNFGAQENLEIALNGKRETFYFPFIDAYVEQVDLEAGEVHVKQVEEFLPDDETEPPIKTSGKRKET